MLTKTYGSAVIGVHAITIEIETSVSEGAHYALVGLPDNAVRESQHRIDTAIRETGFKMPRKKVVINMAPADIRKEGSAYDLTIAAGILISSGQLVPAIDPSKYIIMGELGLDGYLKPIRGALPIAAQAAQEGFLGLIVPKANAREAALVENICVYGIEKLEDLYTFISNGPQSETHVKTQPDITFHQTYPLDFAEVKGQENIKRALEIAAAGGHNAIMIGPPGAGKTMLARRIPSILPPLTIHEALETTKIHSVAGKTGVKGYISSRPFRSPHHTVSNVALVGGGNNPQPGEISLAHHGVLFLDELPEFDKKALEVLRQPLEERQVVISRAKYSIEYPASFMLIASMNPCPCGYYNHPDKECSCPPPAVQKYLSRVSGPLLDRIDIHIEVTPVPFDQLSDRRSAENSEQIRVRVTNARKIQEKRFQGKEGVFCNAQMNAKEIRAICVIDDTGNALLKSAMEKLNLSARAYDRILKVSRTIADLDGSAEIKTEHLAEAIHYRSLDRENWAG